MFTFTTNHAGRLNLEGYRLVLEWWLGAIDVYVLTLVIFCGPMPMWAGPVTCRQPGAMPKFSAN